MAFQERTISELMRNRAATYGNKPFIYFKDEVYSYEQAHDQTSRMAAALARLGVQPGDRVTVGLPNIPETILSYTAIAKAGAAYVAANVALSAREIIYLLNDSEAVAVIATDSFMEKIMPFADELLYVKALIQVGGQAPNGNVVPFAQLLEEPDHLEGLERPSDLMMLSYTSGTTGTPKGAMISFERLLNNTSRFTDAMQITDADISVNTLPYNHIFAPFVEWLPMLGSGGSFVLRERFLPRGVLQDIDRHRATCTIGAPPMFITMLDELKRDRGHYSMESLRFTLVAAASIPLEIQKEFERMTGSLMVQAGGQTEVGPMAVIEPLDRSKGYHPGTCGTILWDDIQVKVVNEDGDEVPLGEVGEMVVKSPDIMLGYWKLPEVTAQTIVNGWLHTGDLVRKDEDGYYYFVDRIKHMIITAGENVYPAEIETVIQMIPEVKEVAVLGMPDPVRGESVEAFILLHDEMQTSDAQILEYCRKNLAPYKVPRKVHFVSEFPKTVTNKIRKVELRQRLMEARQ